MDFFGIEAAVKGAVRVYFQAARATGRTTTLINNLREGDTVCLLTGHRASALRRQCLERGVDITTIVIPPTNLGKMHDFRPSLGRFIFDHDWLEEYYMHQISDAASAIAEIENMFSAPTGARTTPELFTKELRKWQL